MTDKKKEEPFPDYTAEKIDKMFEDAMKAVAEDEKAQKDEKPKYKNIGEGKGGIQMPVD